MVEGHGLVFGKSDATDLREKLQFACDYPEEVNRLKDGAADFICQKYNWDNVVGQTLELYRKQKSDTRRGHGRKAWGRNATAQSMGYE